MLPTIRSASAKLPCPSLSARIVPWGNRSLCLQSPDPRHVSSEAKPPSLEDLQTKWKHLYTKQLPTLAKAKDPAQSSWPVQLDHCFARIILDNAVGKDRPWAQVVKSPAYKNMTRLQLEDAIALGEKLVRGDESLVSLDERSLSLRGKKSKLQRKMGSGERARKRKTPEQNGEDDRVIDDVKAQHREHSNAGALGRKRPRHGAKPAQPEDEA